MSSSRKASLAAAALIVAALAGPARASCAGVPPVRRAVRDARIAFAGTVVDTTSNGRWATVEVTEVWKGDVDARVEVRGGPADPPGPMNAVSSVDRHYREGTTYLFLPYAGHGDTFSDNSCSATTRFTDRIERLRPAGTFVPLDDLRTGVADDGGFPLWAAGALAGAAGAALLLIRRLRNA
ncbi:MAG TPA: hypothetical protein VG318_01785 [Actinomycetota bacterium]|nr:hypothetical protein [Actinomycetota bacterium]